MTPPLLSFLLAGVRQRPEETARLEREKILEQLPFSKAGAKLLVLAGGGPHARLAAHLAAVLGNHPDASITVFHATTTEPSDGSAKRVFDGQFERIKSIAEMSGAHNVYQRSGSAESIAEAIVKESARDYDAIFAGASQAQLDYALGGDVLRELVQRTQAPVIIARDAGLAMPLGRILAPTTGASFSRLATTVALLYAHATGGAVTAMYVRESPLFSWRSLPVLRRGRDEDFHIIKDIRVLADQLELKLETQVAAGARPENAILTTADRGQFDLLVMGVMARPSDRGLYFGPKVEHILRNARCAVAVVVSPQVTARA
jgi:nucleotide-binding universal stress UspA family protein